MKNNIVEIGDVVTLASGGPKMTVASVTPSANPDMAVAHCTWFAEDCRNLSGSFSQALLKLPAPSAEDRKAQAVQDKADAAQEKKDAAKE